MPSAAPAATGQEKVDELVERSRRLQPELAIDVDTLQRRIDACRRDGYYAGFDHAIEGLGAVTVPLTAPGAVSTYVVAIAGLTSQIRREEAEIARDALRIIHAYQGQHAA